MNITQRNYALSRVTEILNRKIVDVRKKYTTKGVDLAKLISSGELKPRTVLTSVDPHSYVRQVFDLSDLRTNDTYDSKRGEPQITALKCEADKVKDHIMLGSESEALKLLAAFDN